MLKTKNHAEAEGQSTHIFCYSLITAGFASFIYYTQIDFHVMQPSYDLNYGKVIYIFPLRNSFSLSLTDYSQIFILSSWALNCLFARFLNPNILYVIILTRPTVLFVVKITTYSLFVLLIHFSYYLFTFITTYSLFLLLIHLSYYLFTFLTTVLINFLRTWCRGSWPRWSRSWRQPTACCCRSSPRPPSPLLHSGWSTQQTTTKTTTTKITK